MQRISFGSGASTTDKTTQCVYLACVFSLKINGLFFPIQDNIYKKLQPHLKE
jgi:hypothetical protein